MPPRNQGDPNHKQENGDGQDGGWGRRRQVSDPRANGYPACNRTCEDVNVTVSSDGVAQHARHPQDDHGVGDQDVAHVLVQAEVLQKEPEQTQMTLLACSLVSLLDVVDGSVGGANQTSRASSSSSSASLAHSHWAAPVWCCRNTVRLRRVKREPSMVYKATPFCTCSRINR